MHINCQLVYANAVSNTHPLHLVSRVASIILRQHHTLHWEWIGCSKFTIDRKDPKPNLIIFLNCTYEGNIMPSFTLIIWGA